MIIRRLPFVLLGAVLVGLLVAGEAEPVPVQPSSFGAAPLAESTPAVFSGNLLSTSWFCPGGPTIDGRSTSITVFNSTDDPREVTISAVAVEGTRATQPLTLAPRNRQVVDLGALAAGQHTAATVAAYGGGVAVEQTVVGRTGTSTSPCADRASSSWYLADGTTTADASLTLALYNPFPDDAVVDIALTTVERTLEPPALQGDVVPGQSVRLIDIGAAAQREEVVSTVVRSRGAQVVAGRIQSADNASRRDFFTAGLAAASPQQTWWFPDGDKGEGISERFVIFNPGDLDASVELSFLPAGGLSLPPAATPTETTTTTTVPEDPGPASTTEAPSPPAGSFVAPVSVVVAPSSFTIVDVNALAEVPIGPHSTLVNVVGDQTPVVIDRLLTRPLEDQPVTNLLLGSQITVADWYVVDPLAALGGVLVVMNSAGLPTTVSVKAIGPAGAVAVPGLEAVAVPAGGSASITVAESAGGLPLLVQGAQPIVVEWRAGVTTGERVGRLDALGFPVIGG